MHFRRYVVVLCGLSLASLFIFWSPLTRPDFFRVPKDMDSDVSVAPCETMIYTKSESAEQTRRDTANMRVVDYNRYQTLEEIECVPLRTALRFERLCIYNPIVDAFISMSVKSNGAWEANILRKIFTLLKRCPDCQFIDVGANIGVFALSVASRCRRVVAVEPLHDNLLRLTKSVRLNKLQKVIVTVANAVSDVYENVSLLVPNGNVGGTHAASHDQVYDNFGNSVKAPHDVPTIYLDDLLMVIDFKNAIMKIDIEGYEIKAIKKAAKLFDTINITHVFMEWEGKEKLPREIMDPFLEFFTSRGYKAHGVELNELRPDFQRVWPGNIVWVRGNHS